MQYVHAYPSPSTPSQQFDPSYDAYPWGQHRVSQLDDVLESMGDLNETSMQDSMIDCLSPVLGLTQAPTPSYTHDSPLLQTETTEDETFLSVSTSFHPGSHSVEPDTIFSSTDGVLFYVHARILTSSSPNAFSAYLTTSSKQGNPTQRFASIPETSTVLNVLLHALYQSSCAQNSPSFEDLATAVNQMSKYGIVPKIHVAPQAPLFSQLLAHAPLRPIEVYALASHHKLEPLAVKSSSHLLGLPLPSISDNLAIYIGPVYLKRLFMLHSSRLAALKNLLSQPPQPHAPTKVCSSNDQKALQRAWALATAEVIWNSRPDLSTFQIQTSFDSFTKSITCKTCEKSTNSRVRDVVVAWASVKCTI